MFSRIVSLVVALAFTLTTLPAAPRPESRTDRILVRFYPGQAPAGDVRPLGRVVRRLPLIGAEVIALDPGHTVAAALATYRADPRVALAEPDRIHRPQLVPNDPGTPLGDAWHLENDGRHLGKTTADISAHSAWNVGTDASSVIVAVLDSGIRYTHEDLAANMWRNTGEIAGNGLDDDGNGYIDDLHGIDAIHGTGEPMDQDGHGTYVAGLIGAVGDNGKGVTGVCWRVQLMAVKVFDSFGGSDSAIIAGMEYAADHGASILNASFGTFGEESAVLSLAIAALEQRGIILVASAGNSAADSDFDSELANWPSSSSHNNVVSVAATTRNDQLASFSSYGFRRVDLGAPGVDLPSTSGASDQAYEVGSGTSAAAPLVAGALALWKALNPTESYRRNIQNLLRGVEPIPALSGRCASGGRLRLLGSGQTPINDAFDRALSLGNDIYFAGSAPTKNGTRVFGEPGTAQRTFWWTWTAPYDGAISIEAYGSDWITADWASTSYHGMNRGGYVRLYEKGSPGFGVQTLVALPTEAGSAYSVRAGRRYYLQLIDSQPGTWVTFRGYYDLAAPGFEGFTLFSLDSEGAGTVGPAALVGDSVQRRGRPLKLIASPAPGYLLWAWVDLTAPEEADSILSRTPTFRFTPTRGAETVRAVFVPNPFLYLRGRYNGLLETATGGVPAGYFTFDLGPGGAFTGALRFAAGGAHAFRGVLRSDQRLALSIPRKGRTPLELTLELNDESRLTGTIAADGATFSLLGEKSDFTVATPPVAVGRYTIRLDAPSDGFAPEGTGFGAVSVSSTGSVRLVGALGDGRAVAQGASLYRIEQWPLYVQPYPTGGVLAGLVSFEVGSCSAQLHWRKAPAPKDAFYREGFETEAALLGQLYVVPGPDDPILTPRTMIDGFDFTATSTAVLVPGFSFFFNVVTKALEDGPPGFRFAVDPRTGLFSGALRTGSVARPFRGALFQETDEGFGYFTIGRQTGAIHFAPAPLHRPPALRSRRTGGTPVSHCRRAAPHLG